MAMSKRQAALVEAINKAAKEQKITQAKMAGWAHISPATVWQGMNGKYDLKEDYWRSICEGLGLDYDEIIDIADGYRVKAEEPSQSAQAVDCGGGGW